MSDKLGYQAFTRDNVFTLIEPDNRTDGGFEFQNHTTYIVARVIRKYGVWRSEKATGARVRRMLNNLALLGYIERSKFYDGFYGYSWRLTELGNA